MKKTIFFVFTLAINTSFLISKTIHVFGDSHASFCFREGNQLISQDFFELPICIGKNNFLVPFTIYWLGPITMHRIGRDGRSFFDLKKFDICEDDVAVFVFGEIDVRCHIGKQRDLKKRNMAQIIDDLATCYLTTIKKNQRLFNQLTCVICSVIPPIEGTERNNAAYPFYGTLSDRIEITRALNQRLQELCTTFNFLFLDIYDMYANPQGALNNLFADSTVHIASKYNMPIKNKLIKLIFQKRI